MKKSDFVKAVLKDSLSLVNEAQVLQNLEIFMKLGMPAPPLKKECFKVNDEGISYLYTYKFRPNQDGDHMSNWEEE